MNPPWIPFGTKTLYKDRQKEFKRFNDGLNSFADDPYMFK